MRSLYVHIPFCLSKCRYCDFNSYAGMAGLIDRYVEALGDEISWWSSLVAKLASPNQPLETVYFGGGTPTLIGVAGLARLLAACRQFDITRDAEISMETNPGVPENRRLAQYRGLGVNRVSIGVQSFDDDLLRKLGRPHSAAEARSTYTLARRAGFDNVNLDLIYGLPGQDLSHWQDTLTQALDLEPEHLSLYALAVEEGTPLAEDVFVKHLELPDQDQCADMYVLAEDLLAAAGYEHYEISNWARPGFRCRHNLTYWRNEPYLGCGAGSHSWLAGQRFNNRSLPADYVSALTTAEMDKSQKVLAASGVLEEIEGLATQPNWSLPESPLLAEVLPWVQESQRLNKFDIVSETIFLGLRLSEGVNLASLSLRFGLDVPKLYARACQEMQTAGLLVEERGRLALTSRGRLLGNEVFLRFLPDDPEAARSCD